MLSYRVDTVIVVITSEKIIIYLSFYLSAFPCLPLSHCLLFIISDKLVFSHRLGGDTAY